MVSGLLRLRFSTTCFGRNSGSIKEEEVNALRCMVPDLSRSFLAPLPEEEVVESEPTTSFSFVRLVLSTGSDFTKRALLLLGHHCHYCYRHLQSKIRSAYLRKRRSSHDSDIGSLNNCSCRNHKHLILRHR